MGGKQIYLGREANTEHGYIQINVPPCGRKGNHISATRLQELPFNVFQNAGIILSHLGLLHPDLGCLPEKPRGTSATQVSKQTRRLIMHHCTPHLSKRRSYATFRDWTLPNLMLIIHQEDYSIINHSALSGRDVVQFSINPFSVVLTPHH